MVAGDEIISNDYRAKFNAVRQPHHADSIGVATSRAMIDDMAFRQSVAGLMAATTAVGIGVHHSPFGGANRPWRWRIKSISDAVTPRVSRAAIGMAMHGR